MNTIYKNKSLNFNYYCKKFKYTNIHILTFLFKTKPFLSIKFKK